MSLRRIRSTTTTPSLMSKAGGFRALFCWFGHNRSVTETAQCGEVAVSGLFLPGRPTAVGRLVMAVVINAINGMFGRRPSAHVLNKSGVGLAPAVADANTTATVMTIANVIRVTASGFHALPDFILWRGFPACALAVRAVRDSRVFSSQATATLCPTGTQRSGLGHDRPSAFAMAKPSAIAFADALFCPEHYRQAAKSLPDQVTTHMGNFTIWEDQLVPIA